eukprot:CAMPEP_0113464208 /NCGR_PEP_ID=MMETSP0014_2-20120614/13079_1 /TAXON_ID=2857 /ORGANISM="Nitzschia sp." /LENGTH=589 /DNA_ID=CAMNT_0000356275 /DNA_START=282 /DNA_END=2051 /DNA_ORIENTATION=- /assembly_acc=CAM_ASM_000159
MDGEKQQEEEDHHQAKEGQVIHIGGGTDDEELLPIMNANDDQQLEKKNTVSKTKTRSSNSRSRNKKKKKKIRFRRCNSSPDFDFISDYDYDLPCTVPISHGPAARTPMSPPPMLRSCLSKNSLDEMVADPDNNEGRWSASSSFSNANSQSQDVNEANNSKMKRNVSFGHIEIREHPIVLGDHPAVSSGPALSLGWYEPDYNNESTNEDDDALSSDLKMCLEEYEKERQEGGAAPRRTGRHQLVVPKHERQRILQKEAGVTMKDMRQVEVETNKIKKSRYKTKEKEQRKFHKEHYNNNAFVSRTFDGVWKKMKVMSASTTTGIGVGRGHHQKQQQQQQRELDDLMYRAALAEQIRKDQQRRHYERQKMKRMQLQQQHRSKNRRGSASGGYDQPPTVPKRGGGSVGGTIDLDQPPTVPRRRGYDDDSACPSQEEDTNEHIDVDSAHACQINTDGDDYDATGVKEVGVTGRSDTQQVPSPSTKSTAAVVAIDDNNKPVSPQQQTSLSTTTTTAPPPSLLSPKTLSHSTSEPLLVWLSHNNNHGDTSSSSTYESDSDGDDHDHDHEVVVNDDDVRVVVGMDVAAIDDDESFMF